MIPEKPVSPPRWAQLLVSLSCDAHERDFLLGDLEEEFHELDHREGTDQARVWYGRQALRSVLPLLASRTVRVLTNPSFTGAVAGCVTGVGTMIVLGCLLLPLVMLFSGYQITTSWPDTSVSPLALMTIQIVMMVLGSGLAGAVSTRISGRKSNGVALVIAVVIIAPQLINTVTYHQQWMLLLIAFLTAMTGIRCGAAVIKRR